MEFYVMTRNGKFYPARMTKNQCKVEGHSSYSYSLRMVFSNTIKLDNNAFITDHAEVDEMIQKLPLIGSCEQMHQTICTALKAFFKSKKLKLEGCKCTIIPGKSPAAFMDYYYIGARSHKEMVSALLST